MLGDQCKMYFILAQRQQSLKVTALQKLIHYPAQRRVWLEFAMEEKSRLEFLLLLQDHDPGGGGTASQMWS
jgi:hypothetical protein